MDEPESQMKDEEWLVKRLETTAQELDWASAMQLRGYVTRVGDGVALAKGLNQIGFEELVRFDSGSLGLAFDLNEQHVGIIVLTDPDAIHEGQGVQGLGRLPDVAVGESLFGRIVDALGRPVDEGPKLTASEYWPVFRPAPEILERRPVDQSLWTGVMAIDSAIPIGRGQRELIIGDRNTGKTALAMDIVAAQDFDSVACVYVVIGQPMSRVLSLQRGLEEAGCLQNTVIVAADASSCPGMQYLAPYAGTSIAEWFRSKGQHALVVYDDLTKHADAYREMALLLDRPPGREAYPGDIFHVHSELLERSAALSADMGGGSVTALPLIETTEGDISSYIPTNLISITDGQIYLDSVRFEKNLRPAVDIGRSVSRIGSKAQNPLIKKAARNLRIEISRFESLESLTRVGFEMDATMNRAIQQGTMMRELLRQLRFSPRDPFQQALALIAIRENWLEGVPVKQAAELLTRIEIRATHENSRLVDRMRHGECPDDWISSLASIAELVREEWRAADSENAEQTITRTEGREGQA